MFNFQTKVCRPPGVHGLCLVLQNGIVCMNSGASCQTTSLCNVALAKQQANSLTKLSSMHTMILLN